VDDPQEDAFLSFHGTGTLWDVGSLRGKVASMKRFDVLTWLRKVRDTHYQQERNSSPEQVIEGTQAQAKEFRMTRPRRRTRSKSK
jgi:hypothetical protein